MMRKENGLLGLFGQLLLPFRQLKWKIIAGHMLVVLVGVLTLSLVGELVLLRTVPIDLESYLKALSMADDPDAVQEITADLLQQFYHDAVSRSLLVAAVGAILAGLLTSLFLAREILRPLQDIAASSRRIANGHYRERVAVPGSTELANVATNFNQMAEALEQIEQQRIALISNVSHELRTPLTGISGYLEGLMDGLFTNDRETFAQMDLEVRRLRRLVDDLQALSRVEAGQISLRMDVVDLAPIVARTVNQLNTQAVGQGLALTLEQEQAGLFVCADPDRTAQVLLNLIGNAIRYTPEGGSIKVKVFAEAGVARVSVSDTGIGIPPAALPYIFERFYRVDRSRARISGGSGIGLTISRHLAWAMGGDISAASAGPDQGSAFTFTLPLTGPSLSRAK